MNYEVLIKNYHLLTTSSLVVVNDKLQVVYSEPKLEVLPSKLYQAIAIDLKDVDRAIGDPKLVDAPEDFGYIKHILTSTISRNIIWVISNLFGFC